VTSARACRLVGALITPCLTAAPACGGRTSILEADYEYSGGAQSAATGGTAASNGLGSSSGGASGLSGTSSGGTGAGGATFGSSGGATGDLPAASGGVAGTGTSGGTAGSNGGQGGIAVSGETGGSPDVLAACETACRRQPAACLGSQSADCDFSCRQLATQFPGCKQEITDYLDCLSGALDPNAQCLLADNGNCYGDHCTTWATSACSDLLQVFSSCQAGAR
jgi:hypothetical protein